MPQLVESCGMFFLCSFLPLPFFPVSDFLEKNMPFYFVLSPICAIFAVSINIRSFLRYQKYSLDPSTHSKYK